MNTRTVTVSGLAVIFCLASAVSAGPFSYSDFSSASGLAFVGSASVQNNAAQLTPDQAYVAGAVWNSTKQSVSGGFTSTFSFKINATGQAADGIWFVLRNDAFDPSATRATAFPGIYSPGSICVEFDIYKNYAQQDPNGNHIGLFEVQNDADTHNHKYCIASETSVPDMADGNVHVAQIQYSAGQLSVNVDSSPVPQLVVPFTLSAASFPDGSAFLGLAAETGDPYAEQQALSWSYVPEPATMSLLGLAGLAMLRRRRQ